MLRQSQRVFKLDGPELGGRRMGTVNLLLLPFVLLFRVSLLIFSLLIIAPPRINTVYNIFFNQTTPKSALLFSSCLFREASRISRWAYYLTGHLIIFGINLLYWSMWLVCFPAHQFLSGMTFIFRFYWSLFGPSLQERIFRSILSVPQKGMGNRKL